MTAIIYLPRESTHGIKMTHRTATQRRALVLGREWEACSPDLSFSYHYTEDEANRSAERRSIDYAFWHDLPQTPKWEVVQLGWKEVKP